MLPCFCSVMNLNDIKLLLAQSGGTQGALLIFLQYCHILASSVIYNCIDPLCGELYLFI